MSDISRALSKPTICCTVSVPGHAWITAFLNKHWGCKQASLCQLLNLLRLRAKSEKSLQIRRPTEAQNVSTEISWKSIKENFKQVFTLVRRSGNLASSLTHYIVLPLCTQDFNSLSWHTAHDSSTETSHSDQDNRDEVKNTNRFSAQIPFLVFDVNEKASNTNTVIIMEKEKLWDYHISKEIFWLSEVLQAVHQSSAEQTHTLHQASFSLPKS